MIRAPLHGFAEGGSSRAQTEAIVVLGASGGIGRGIVQSLLGAGHTVIAVGRNQERLAALAQGIVPRRRLALVQGSVASDHEAAALVQSINGLRMRPVAVIASLGGTLQSGRLLEKPASFLQRTFDEDVTPHFIAAKHFLPVLAESQPGGLYLLLSGPAAQCAWSGYGHRSVAAAALRMLTLVLREEAKDLHVRVQQLQLGTPVRTHRNADCACPDWPSAEEVGQRIVEMIKQPGACIPIIELGSYAAKPRADRAVASK